MIQRTLLLIVILSTSYGTVCGQCIELQKRIKIKCNWCNFEQFIGKIESQSDLNFNYSNDDLKKARFEFIYKDSISIEALLNSELFSRGLTFDCISEKGIVVFQETAIQTAAVSGLVIDPESLQPVEDVFVRSKTGKWTFSNEDGYFRFKNIRFPDTLSFERIGFISHVIVCNSPSDISLVELKANDHLQEVRITGIDSNLLELRKGGWFVNFDHIRQFPSLKASPGVINQLALLPGMQSTVEVNGGIVVRGGGKDQNLVLLDGMEIYNPTHMFGMFGAFSEYSLQGVEMYKGTFPGKYNGRLSSVINMRSKRGNLKNWKGSAFVNPLFGGFQFNGPILKEKTSISISARRSFTDFFPVFYQQVQQQNSVDRFRFFFYDISANVNHRVSASNSFFVNSYFGGDVGYINQRENFKAQTTKSEESRDQFLQSNSMLSVGWRKWWNESTGSKLCVGLTRYKFDYSNRYQLLLSDDSSSYERNTRLDFLSQIQDRYGKLDLFGHLGQKGSWGAGIHLIRHTITPNESNYFLKENDLILIDTSFNNRRSELNEIRFYGQIDKQIGRFRIHAGMSAVKFGSDSSYFELQPRFYLESNVNKRSQVHFSYSRTAQFVHAVPNNSLGIPLDVWMPSDRQIRPMSSEQFEIGWKLFTKKKYSFQIDLYQRQMFNVLSYQYSVYDLVADWTDAVNAGRGRSYGVDFMAQKRSGRLNGWIKYTLSRSERRFAHIRNGDWFPFKYDRRHDFSLVAQYLFNKKWNIGLNCVYASGHYITVPEAQYVIEINGNSTLISNFGALNNLKVPDYFRADIGLNYSIVRKKTSQSLSLKVYNLTNRQNVYYVSSRINENGVASLAPISLFPLLPTINYAISF